MEEPAAEMFLIPGSVLFIMPTRQANKKDQSLPAQLGPHPHLANGCILDWGFKQVCNVILMGFDKGIWWLQGKSIIIHKTSSYKSNNPPPAKVALKLCNIETPEWNSLVTCLVFAIWKSHVPSCQQGLFPQFQSAVN